MSTSKHIDLLCIAAVLLACVTTFFVLRGYAASEAADGDVRPIGYEKLLFDDSYVHRIDLVMDGFDEMVGDEHYDEKKYYPCAIVIDGEVHRDVGIRVRGNLSLSRVSSVGNGRFNFKVEFDQYEDGKSYHGLDKLGLTGLVQDNTMMKDFLSYRMMRDFGVDAPLCSYAYLTVNGEDFGLYLAVECVEESFLERNYGHDSGCLYKPERIAEARKQESYISSADSKRGMDVALKYQGDSPESYPNLFAPLNVKTDVTYADKRRLIEVIQCLNDRDDPEDVLDADEILRYFVTNIFLFNEDSYGGNTKHNYYLHENNGRVQIIPWDCNFSFRFISTQKTTPEDFSHLVNADVDDPYPKVERYDRPLFAWIFSDAVYETQYHNLFSDLLTRYFTDGELVSFVRSTQDMILPYVEKDPTKFCTTEEFDLAVDTLTEFLTLRAESVRRQLAGDDTPVDVGDLNLTAMGK